MMALNRGATAMPESLPPSSRNKAALVKYTQLNKAQSQGERGGSRPSLAGLVVHHRSAFAAKGELSLSANPATDH